MQVLRAVSTSKWWQVRGAPSAAACVSDASFQGRLRGKIGLFPSNFVSPTAQAALAEDILTDVEIRRLQAQLKLMPL